MRVLDFGWAFMTNVSNSTDNEEIDTKLLWSSPRHTNQLKVVCANSFRSHTEKIKKIERFFIIFQRRYTYPIFFIF